MAFAPIYESCIGNTHPCTGIDAGGIGEFAFCEFVTEKFAVHTVGNTDIVGILLHDIDSLLSCRSTFVKADTGVIEDFAVAPQVGAGCYSCPELVALGRKTDMLCSIETDTVNTCTLELSKVFDNTVLNV